MAARISFECDHCGEEFKDITTEEFFCKNCLQEKNNRIAMLEKRHKDIIAAIEKSLYRVESCILYRDYLIIIEKDLNEIIEKYKGELCL